jgi:hypothetical protein
MHNFFALRAIFGKSDEFRFRLMQSGVTRAKIEQFRQFLVFNLNATFGEKAFSSFADLISG